MENKSLIFKPCDNGDVEIFRKKQSLGTITEGKDEWFFIAKNELYLNRDEMGEILSSLTFLNEEKKTWHDLTPIQKGEDFRESLFAEDFNGK